MGAVGTSTRLGRAAGKPPRCQMQPLHLVTRSSAKVLMPWAAFSLVSSLAGGPCPRTQCHQRARRGLRTLPSASLSGLAMCKAWPWTPGPGVAAGAPPTWQRGR